MTTVLFVHGTGVRKDSFEATFRAVERGVAEHLRGARVAPCFWGESEGAKLLGGGRSIPDYDTARGGARRGAGERVRGATQEEQMAALLELLAVDPFFELRLLALSGPTAGPAPEGAWRAALEQRLLGLGRGPSLARPGEAPGWDEATALALPAAVARLQRFEDLDAALRAAGPADAPAALARALTALVLPPEAPSAVRRRLTAQLATELSGRVTRGSMVSLVLAPFKGLALAATDLLLRRKRGALTDFTTPAAADILLYQARGQGIRAAIRAEIERIAGPVVVLAHSLGGIASFELLVGEEPPRVEHLITVGSQAPFLYELDALGSLRYGQPLPDGFPRWTNVFDRRDILSYQAQPLFPSAAVDMEVDGGEPFPAAHGAYWENPDFWQKVARAVGGGHG